MWWVVVVGGLRWMVMGATSNSAMAASEPDPMVAYGRRSVDP